MRRGWDRVGPSEGKKREGGGDARIPGAMDYRQAGVDIDAADSAKARIKGLARATFNPSVLSEIGVFGSMFRPDLARYQDPVLVASTDGVGTKIHVAILADVHDTVGYDLVAHCVDDILVQGATPLFFLDYIALGKMDPERVEQIVSGFARACAEFGCPLIGGETAEMPGTYAPDDYDLAGFIVGVADRERLLTGDRVREGDVLIGLPSTGLHTNGYSLARKVFFDELALKADSEVPALGVTVAEALLVVHRSYLPAVGPLVDEGFVRSAAHITGGGIPDNLPRALPAGVGAEIFLDSWDEPPLFRVIREGGRVPEDDMRRTFNLGVGMILVVAPEKEGTVLEKLVPFGPGWVIGLCVAGRGVRFVAERG